MKTAKGLRKVIRTEIQQTMITNVKRGKGVPDPGEPWRAFLFVQPIYEAKDGCEKRGGVHVEVLENETSDGLDQELLTYCENPGRVLLEEGLELMHFRKPAATPAGRAEASK